MTRHYLDHAASSPMPAEVAETMARAWTLVGNPSSLHTSGRRARALLEDAREQLAGAVDADPAQVVFTSGGTEAANLAVVGGRAARAAQRPGVVMSTVEHPCVLETERAYPGEAALCPVDSNGVLRLDTFADSLTSGVGVASVQWVNNETGVVQPVADAAAMAQAHGVWMHTDAVQALGHVPVSMRASGVDMLSLSAHKVGGPVGIGALVVRREVTPTPIGFGGGQERRLRSGTVPVALAVGFAAAAVRAVDALALETARLAALRERLVAGAVEIDGVSLNGGERTSPHIVHLSFAGCVADDLLLLLDRAGIDCSTGSACTAGVHQPSHVLAAMGADAAACSSGLRFSFGHSTSDHDVEAVLAALPAAVRTARAAAH